MPSTWTIRVQEKAPSLTALTKQTAAIPLTSALTLPARLKYSSSHLQIRHTHIAPLARREAHSGIPRTGAGARIASRTDGKHRQRHTCSTKGICMIQTSPNTPIGTYLETISRLAHLIGKPRATDYDVRASCRFNSTAAACSSTAASAEISGTGSAAPWLPGAFIATTSKRNLRLNEFQEAHRWEDSTRCDVHSETFFI